MQGHEEEDLGREILLCPKLKRKLRRCPRFVNSIIQTHKKTSLIQVIVASSLCSSWFHIGLASQPRREPQIGNSASQKVVPREVRSKKCYNYLCYNRNNHTQHYCQRFISSQKRFIINFCSNSISEAASLSSRKSPARLKKEGRVKFGKIYTQSLRPILTLN